jgi:hypothetical protein
VALALAALAFLSFPLLRPWHDEGTRAGAIAAFGSGAWVASHLMGALGFVLVPLGLLAVRSIVFSAPTGRLAMTSVVLCWLGAGLLLPFFGAETFGLNAIATAGSTDATLDVLALSEAVRMGSAAVTTFGIGLLAVAVGSIAAAVAIARSGVLPRYAGLLFAIGMALYLPQFFGPPWVRIAHGVLLALGLVFLALATWNAARDEPAPAATDPTTVESPEQG